MRGGKRIALGMIAAALGLLWYCGSFYWKSCLENSREQKKYEELRETCVEQPTDDPGEHGKTDQEKEAGHVPGEDKDIRESFGINWAELRSRNSQTAAWISIPGLDISYPVVQGEDDEYYLTHNFVGEESPFGCIYLSCQNKGNFGDSHSFLYGHNIDGNFMFANLNQYEDRNTLLKSPEFYILTPSKKFCYKIFSVEQAESQSLSFRYGYQLGSEEYQAQLKALAENSMYPIHVATDADKPMLTLVTCNSRLEKEVRMAIHGICEKVLWWTEES